MIILLAMLVMAIGAEAQEFWPCGPMGGSGSGTINLSYQNGNEYEFKRIGLHSLQSTALSRLAGDAYLDVESDCLFEFQGASEEELVSICVEDISINPKRNSLPKRGDMIAIGWFAYEHFSKELSLIGNIYMDGKAVYEEHPEWQCAKDLSFQGKIGGGSNFVTVIPAFTFHGYINFDVTNDPPTLKELRRAGTNGDE